MKLLIACPKKLLLANTEDGRVETVERHRPEYYGISWFADGGPLCLSHSGVENASLGSLQSYMDSERGWVSCGAESGPESLSVTHQILCVKDRVIATNTGRNCLTVFRTDDWFYRHFWIDQIRWDRQGRENRCGSHYNSIFHDKNQLYVVAHNHDRGSAIVRLSWPEMEVIGVDKTSTYMAHNVWVTEEQQVILCDSMRGTVVDAKSGEVLWRCETRDVVTRGLASDGQYVFVGHSAIGTREARVNRDSRVWILDRSNWKTVDSILLPGSGNVHELRILDRPDLCHHGHVYRGEISFERQTAAADTETVPSLVAMTAHDSSTCGRPQTRTMVGGRDRWEEHVSFAELTDRRAVASDFSLATLTGFNATDVQVQAQIDLSSPTARHAGVIGRYQGPADNNMVVALVVKGERGYGVQLWRQLHGAWSCLDSHGVRHGQGLLQLSLEGPRASVHYRGKPLIDTTLSGSIHAGAVGIRSAMGSLSDFRLTYEAARRVSLRRRSA